MVLIYHYFCLAHPRWTADMSADPRALVDTPVYMLWNGAFAVALFFVLSGYVMAAAARRRRSSLVANTAARYLRLAVPAAASCILAWIWLSMLPGAAETMAESVQNASRWLEFTYQDDIETPIMAVADGLGAIFVRGFSRFNNVLWTMKIELFGSLVVFALYFLTSGRLRLVLLGLGTVILPPLTEPSYLAFGLGAMLYETHRSGLLSRLDRVPGIGSIVLIAAIMLSFPGNGFHIRESLPYITEDWQLGEHRGYLHVLGGTLLIVEVLQIRMLAWFFETAIAQWLGRISFSLYLIHVPLLYTFVAWLFVESAAPSPLIASGFIACSLLLAMVFERFIDRPLMQNLPRFRRGFDKRTGLGQAMHS